MIKFGRPFSFDEALYRALPLRPGNSQGRRKTFRDRYQISIKGEGRRDDLFGHRLAVACLFPSLLPDQHLHHTFFFSVLFTSAASAATALPILFVIVFLCSTSLPIPSRFFDLCDPSTPGQQDVAFVLYPCSWPIRANNLESSNPFYPCRSTYYPAGPRLPGSIIQLYLFLIRPAASTVSIYTSRS